VLRDIPTPAYLSKRKPVNNTASRRATDHQKKQIHHLKFCTMHFPFSHPHPNDLKDKSNESIFDPVHDPNAYTNEGSEFLDDAIRIKDQPLQYAEKSIAVGNPEGLL
jgi:hypothetical protein